MTERTRRLPLRGADLALLAMYHRYARTKASHNTITVVECDRPIAPERVRRGLDRLLDSAPGPHPACGGRFPWGALHWAAGPREALVPPPVRHRSVSSPAELHDALEAGAEHARSIRGTRRRFGSCSSTASREGTGRHGFLVVTWFHSLMDPRGAENLLRHLVDLDADGRCTASRHASPPFTGAQDPRPLRERARLAVRTSTTCESS